MPQTDSRPVFRRRLLAYAGAVWGQWALSGLVTTAVAKTGADVLLAHNARAQLNPALYLISEKLDGVRAIWDGTTLKFRSGRTVNAPAWFLAKLPKVPVDGELWLDRGKFDVLSGMVRKAQPVDADWEQVKYLIFELPGGEGDFAARAARIKLIVRGTNWSQLQAVEQFRLPDQPSLKARLKLVVAVGGEGLMLHRSNAPYVTGRNEALLKLKEISDAEAEVVAHIPGKGKYAGVLGALEVKTDDGLRFRLGTGFSDEQRKTPPPVGSKVTYTYRDLTPSGKPRFAAFLRVAAAD